MAMLGNLGDIVFQVYSGHVLNYESVSRTATGKYADHQVIKRKPISEWTGPDLDQVSISMTFNASLGIDPAAESDKLREMINGKAHSLVLGNEHWGMFTIRNVTDESEIFMRGQRWIVTVTVDLVEWADDQGTPGAQANAREAANRGITGAGGPLKVANAPAPLQARSLTPRI